MGSQNLYRRTAFHFVGSATKHSGRRLCPLLFPLGLSHCPIVTSPAHEAIEAGCRVRLGPRRTLVAWPSSPSASGSTVLTRRRDGEPQDLPLS